MITKATKPKHSQETKPTPVLSNTKKLKLEIAKDINKLNELHLLVD